MTQSLQEIDQAATLSLDRTQLDAILLEEFASSVKRSVGEIDLDKTFDEYGLDSIDGVLMTGAIGDRLNIDLPPEFLMQYRKVGDAFSAIAVLAGVENTVQVATPTRPHVYLFAGGAGRDGRLATLAERCTDTIAGTFIPLGNWREWVTAGGKLQHIVEACCDRIVSLKPEGPLRLSGYSQGGQLAFASAVELTKRGRSVDLVVLIDSPVASRGKTINVFTYGIRNAFTFAKLGYRQIRRRFSSDTFLVTQSNLNDDDFGRMASLVRLSIPTSKIGSLYERISGVLNERDAISFDNSAQIQYLDMLWEQWIAHLHQPLPAETHVWLLRSEDEGASDLGWSRLCTRLSIRQADGAHLAMFDAQNLDSLAASFSDIVLAP